MPNELPAWTEDNLCKVLSDLFTEAVRDQGLHQQLLNNPFEILSQRIQIPATYQKNFLAKPKGSLGMILTVPPYVGTDAPATAMDAEYTIVCTIAPW